MLQLRKKHPQLHFLQSPAFLTAIRCNRRAAPLPLANRRKIA
jgi:hypothetical protein